MSRLHRNERGASAILAAAALVFLMGSAALAVDVSGFYQVARTDQTTADLACLAGAKELPNNAAAINVAAAYAKANWSALSGASVTIAGSTGTLSDGTGNSVTFEAGYGGDPKRMHVVVTERAATQFGRVVGAQAVDVTQEAFCTWEAKNSGSGSLPFGILPGGFGGGLFGPNPCGTNSGNCGSLFIARDDTTGSGPTMIENIARGADRQLAPWLGNITGATLNCASVGSGDTCHIVSTDTGVSAAHMGQGFFERLRNDPGASCTFSFGGSLLNCDTPAQVLGATPTPLFSAFGSQPAWWNTSLYGPWTAAATASHYWYDGVIAKCDSPRLATVPIVSQDMSWDLGDPNPGWPPGNKDMKIVALVNVILVDPNAANDFQGSGNLKRATVVVMWYGPNAVCTDGTPFGVLNGVTGIPVKAVKLVAG
jgi:Flp pilus assembly protein TadG